MVAFTGGIDTGRSVAQACARQYKRALIETSGNDPFIVMPSAPIAIAARAAVFGACGLALGAVDRAALAGLLRAKAAPAPPEQA